MFFIRPIEAKDLAIYQELAFNASPGITTLPKSKPLLEKKINFSNESFQKKTTAPNHELYLFVLEDFTSQMVGGTCGIYSQSGMYSSPCFYDVVAEKLNSPLLTSEVRVLHPKKYTIGPSEVCGIFLKKEFRHSGLGKLLSLSRFLFMATFPHLFTHTIISSIRGWIDPAGNSPFWNSLGRHFLPIPLKEAFPLLENKKISYEDILSRYPIPLALLSHRARAVIGKPHRNSKPALMLLQKEGFRVSSEIDILDGGPKLIAQQEHIHTILKNKVARISEITKEPIDSVPYLLSNQSKAFRVCYGNLNIQKDGTVSIPAKVCEMLQVDKGDSVRFLDLSYHDKKGKPYAIK
ncbi:MAG: arginine N-succinyltransferase [Parachlamydia sp.]|nr:MAG: arginine N-succinyltransferase [Parachlamydia sp.]